MTTTLGAETGSSQASAPSAGTPRAASRWQHKYSMRLRINDTVIVGASVMLAHVVRFGASPNTSGSPGPLMTLFSCLFAALWLSSISVFHTRSPRIIGAGIDEYRRIGRGGFLAFGLI